MSPISNRWFYYLTRFCLLKEEILLLRGWTYGFRQALQASAATGGLSQQKWDGLATTAERRRRSRPGRNVTSQVRLHGRIHDIHFAIPRQDYLRLIWSWVTSLWQCVRVIQVLALLRSSFIAEFHKQHPVQHHLGDIPPLAPHQTHRKHIESTPTTKAVTDLKIFDDFLHNRSPDSQWTTSTAEGRFEVEHRWS